MKFNEKKLKTASTTDIIKELKVNRFFVKEEADDLINYLQPTSKWLTNDNNLDVREFKLLRETLREPKKVMVKNDGIWYEAIVDGYVRPNDSHGKIEVIFDIIDKPYICVEKRQKEITLTDPYIWKGKGEIRFTQ